ncbi:MAG TPA: hypothetical protein DCG57_19415 [Candidatus Riflebacteria bacterium]|jgi:serine phosphatase RsbU (regulator of sigma subunit)|nr:hypothetical protein [Candidatus Riflebacteria bacterium]
MSSVLTINRTSRVSGYLPAILALLVFYLLVYSGFSHFEQRHQDLLLQEFSQQSASLLDQMTLAGDSEAFWVRKLNNGYRESADYKSFIDFMARQREASGGRLFSVIWDAGGKIVVNEHFKNMHDKSRLLKELFHDLRFLYNTGEKHSSAVIDRMKVLLGPYLDAIRLIAAIYSRHPVLVRPDTAGNFPDFWVASEAKFTALVFFDRELLNADAGLISFSKEFRNADLRLGFIKNGGGKPGERQHAWLEDAVEKLAREVKSAGFVDQIMVAGRKISGNRILIAFKRYRPLLNPGRLATFLALISIFVLLMILKTADTGLRIDRCSVKLQLLLMLMVTTGLPLLFLLMSASDHVARKRTALIKSAYQTCIGYLQHVDRRSLINHASMINRVNRAMASIKEILPEKFGSNKIAGEIKMHIGESLQDMRLIASSPPVLMNLAGVFENNRFTPFKDKQKLQGKETLELKMFRDVSSYYLSVINSRPIGLEKFSETELIAEMVYQRPFHEIIQNLMLATDKIVTLGWGDRSNPVLLKLLSLNDNLIVDYFCMIILRNTVMQREFLSRQIDSLERNPLGLKLLYSDGLVFSRDSLLVAGNKWFSEIFRNTREHPAVEPLFTSMDGKDYVFAGMRSQNLSAFYFYAFYPLENIDAQIAEELRFMLSAGVVTIILLIGLALVFSASFVSPLSALQAGAIAIRKRDFSYRLSELADDEFGEMARVFNNSMADFEELSLAGIVQARLLPQQGISEERFNLYGRNIPMTELGGDYFDYFQIDGDNYVIMAGDVAGHGVGASLIMAMAKAGVMRCHDCLNDPAQVLARLHQIIHETRSKVQRKVMTFQYLYFNADSGAGVYANAGACSPILVDHAKQQTSEITLQAPVLGGFKKSKFSNLDLQMSSGQALVFYTDGIIETLNPDGREIGYEGFQQMLLECYDTDARCYYENIYSRYIKWLGSNQPQDDLTLIILLRR